jgi:hypothetical protein
LFTPLPVFQIPIPKFNKLSKAPVVITPSFHPGTPTNAHRSMSIYLPHDQGADVQVARVGQQQACLMRNSKFLQSLANKPFQTIPNQ